MPTGGLSSEKRGALTAVPAFIRRVGPADKTANPVPSSHFGKSSQLQERETGMAMNGRWALVVSTKRTTAGRPATRTERNGHQRTNRSASSEVGRSTRKAKQVGHGRKQLSSALPLESRRGTTHGPFSVLDESRVFHTDGRLHPARLATLLRSRGCSGESNLVTDEVQHDGGTEQTNFPERQPAQRPHLLPNCTPYRHPNE